MDDTTGDAQGNAITGGTDSSSKDMTYALSCMLTPHPKTTSQPQPAINNKPIEKTVERTLQCDEYGRMLDFGLGRGVNATHRSPWFQKSTFQVRGVSPHNIVGTEEGGILKSYVREVWSIEEVQSLLSASVPISTKVSIGVDAELSRSYNTSRRSIGQHLVTRTISFKPDFEHDQHIQCTCMAKPDLEAPFVTFEERVAQWILNKVNIKLLEGNSPLDVLTKFIESPPGNIGEIQSFLEKLCLEFVKSYNITHYVSGIKLGAAKYEVLSEEEYLTKVGTKNQLEILKLANLSGESRFTFNWGASESMVTEIGRFKNVKNDGAVNGGTVHKIVERGTADEAVVGVEFQPISALLTVQKLKDALIASITEYIHAQDQSNAGPFIISCNDEKLFLKVDPERNYAVGVTQDMEQASDFFISYDEDGHSAYEFSLMYLAESPLHGIDPIPRYLYAPVNLLGTNSGPLTFRLDADNKHSKMILQSRRVRHTNPADTKDWMNSHDIFYICCKDRSFYRDGYICVKQTRDEEYTTCCVSTIKKEELSDHHMLFRLIRSSKKGSERKETWGKRHELY